MTTEPTPRRRRSRTLEVLKEQNAAERQSGDISEEELGLISKMMLRASEITGKKKP